MHVSVYFREMNNGPAFGIREKERFATAYFLYTYSASGGTCSTISCHGTTTTRLPPVLISSVTGTWKSVAAGNDHSLAVRWDGTLWAWGRNAAGEVGDGTKTQRDAPVQVGSDANWVPVHAGWGTARTPSA